MVFLIQNSQNRVTDVLHIKIDELLRATQDTHNATLSLDGQDLMQLEKLCSEYRAIGQGSNASGPSAWAREHSLKTNLNQC
ncbi:hypothetical protein GV819_19465 [Pseudomonas sp. Fl5BN2]|nr:hypothetical protein [Pseudomonas sp. Fl5BN2]